MGANSRLGAYSNKYGTRISSIEKNHNAHLWLSSVHVIGGYDINFLVKSNKKQASRAHLIISSWVRDTLVYKSNTIDQNRSLR